MKKRILSIFIACVMVLQVVYLSNGNVYAEGVDIKTTVERENAGTRGIIDEDGNLWMCGNNLNGQVGDGTQEDKSKLVKVLNNVEYVDIFSGKTYAIKKDGSLWIWGKNRFGRVGDGTKENKLVPTKILDDVVSVVPDYYYTCAIKKDGSLWIWGSNGSGSTSIEDTNEILVPTKISEDVKSVKINFEQIVAHKKDGSLWVRRVYNSQNTDNKIDKDSLALTKVLDNVKYFNIDDEFIAIKEDDSLWMWGYYTDEFATDKTRPSKVLDDVSFACAGDGTTAIIKKDGSLWMMGGNYAGQIGDGTKENVVNPIKILDNVRYVNIYRARKSVERITLAIKEDNSLWMWGSNSSGQLGNGSKEEYLKPMKVLDNVEYAVTDITMTYAVKTDGSLWMWGNNKYNNINGEEVAEILEPVKVLEDVLVASTGFATTAIKKDGSVWTWGFNRSGTIGDGTTEDRETPYEIPNIKVDTTRIELPNFSYGYSKPELTTPFFSNVKASDWYYDATRYCYDNGLIEGVLTGKDLENKPLTRAEFLSIFMNAMEIDTDKVVPTNEFTDVEKGSWYEKAVYWAYANGVVNGTSPNTFSPQSGITREQAATIIIRYFEKNNISYEEVDSPVNFVDSGKISGYAKDFVSKAAKYGLFLGDENKNFNPQKNITQPQGLTMFMRLYESIMDGVLKYN